MRRFIVVYFLSLFLTSTAQVNLDSLWSVWNEESQADTNRLNAIHKIARDYLYTQPDSAFYFAQLQYDYAKSKGLKKQMARALNTQGVSFKIQGDYVNAMNYHTRCLFIREEIGHKKGIANSLNNIGLIYYDQGDYASALDNHTRSLTIMEEIGHKRGIAGSLTNIGNIYKEQGNYASTIDYYTRSLTIMEEIGDKKGIANSINNIGLIYDYQGDYASAIDYLTRSLTIREESGDKKGIAGSLTNIGIIYADQGDYASAMDYFTRSLTIKEEIGGDKKGIANSLNNIGNIYSAQGNYANAMDYHTRSFKISEQIGDKWGIAISLGNIGHIYKNQGDYASAIDNYTHSLTIMEEIGYKQGVAASLINIVLIYQEQDDYVSAMAYSIRALKLAQEVGTIVETKNAASALYEAYKATGHYEKALEMHELYITMRDSLESEENEREVIRQEYKYAYEKEALADSLAQEEESLQTELSHQASLNKKDRTRNIFLSIGILVLLAAGGLWSRVRYIRKSNVRLAKEKDRAERSEQFKQQFLANMSHEIRTPMNAVLGMTNLTLDTPLNEKQNKYLGAVKKSSESLLVIIDDILDLSKLEAGKMELEKIPFKLGEQINQVYDTLQFKADEKGLILQTHISDEVPEALIGDPSRLNQILINLCGNAIKFTEKGSVTISVEKVPGTDTKLLFKVTDTGIGIHEDKLEQLFSAFQQEDSTISRKYGGTGLGLSISKTLVELQGGKLEVHSEEGKGSEFSFTIPYAIATVEEVEKLEAQSHPANQSLLKGIRILIAEDNEFNQVVINDTLENLIEDVTIDLADNGQIAIEKHEQNDYDLILMDAKMPEMDGLEASRYIRQNMEGKKKDIPIIALTASVLNTDIRKCLEAGMNAYIPKPFKREELVGTLARFYANQEND